MRKAKLLVSIRAVSGRYYPAGTTVALSGGGAVTDGFVNGDWLSLSWWEFVEAPAPNEGSPPSPHSGRAEAL